MGPTTIHNEGSPVANEASSGSSSTGAIRFAISSGLPNSAERSSRITIMIWSAYRHRMPPHLIVRGSIVVSIAPEIALHWNVYSGRIRGAATLVCVLKTTACRFGRTICRRFFAQPTSRGILRIVRAIDPVRVFRPWLGRSISFRVAKPHASYESRSRDRFLFARRSHESFGLPLDTDVGCSTRYVSPPTFIDSRRHIACAYGALARHQLLQLVPYAATAFEDHPSVSARRFVDINSGDFCGAVALRTTARSPAPSPTSAPGNQRRLYC